RDRTRLPQRLERRSLVAARGARAREVEERLHGAEARGERGELSLGRRRVSGGHLEEREGHREVALERAARGGRTEVRERLVLALLQDVEAREVLVRRPKARLELQG